MPKADQPEAEKIYPGNFEGRQKTTKNVVAELALLLGE